MSPFVDSTVFLALLVCASACSKEYEGKEIVDKILKVVRNTLPASGFEVDDFKVGWYNDNVDKKFKLDYDNDTVALSTLTIPGVFNGSFIPFLCEEGLHVANGSWHKLMKYYMDKVQANLKKDLTLDVPAKDILYSDKMIAYRHPAVLVQIAAHVAGGAYYYHPKDVINPSWPQNMTIYGVSLHPKYVGWFLMGPVIILDCVKYADMPKKHPPDILKTNEKKIEFLVEVNSHPRARKWRNIIMPEKKYSKDHFKYKMTYGTAKIALVKQLHKNNCKV